MSEPLVEVDDLRKAYQEGGAEATVLNGVTFQLEPGETTSLVGSSGAGKSTLLSILAGLMLPDSGSVRFAGEELTAMDEVGRARLRANRIGVVLQRDNLIPFLTATENVELAIELADAESSRERAQELLTELGLSHRLDELPRRLSGGENQRAALAVALVNQPDLLLADEVTAELDSASARRVLDLILGISRERGLAVLLVTHSSELAGLASRTLRVAEGQVALA